MSFYNVKPEHYERHVAHVKATKPDVALIASPEGKIEVWRYGRKVEDRKQPCKIITMPRKTD